MDNYAVMGNPVAHSKSPMIHKLFAEQTKKNDHTYTAILVERDGLKQALHQFTDQGGKGVNITLPFKHQAYALVTELTDRAKRAKAINTIKVQKDGTYLGDNTDGAGLVKDIKLNHKFTLKNKHVLILGAGGAVSGILEPLLQEHPSEVIITNRTENKAVALAEEFSDLGAIQACPLELLENNSYDLVINATSMSLQNEMLELPGSILKEGAFCYDLMCGNGATPFLLWAKEQGAEFCADGIGMLVEQAAESFYLWHQIKPDTQQVLAKIK